MTARENEVMVGRQPRPQREMPPAAGGQYPVRT
jgi:hypothetical protein